MGKYLCVLGVFFLLNTSWLFDWASRNVASSRKSETPLETHLALVCVFSCGDEIPLRGTFSAAQKAFVHFLRLAFGGNWEQGNFVGGPQQKCAFRTKFNQMFSFPSLFVGQFVKGSSLWSGAETHSAWISKNQCVTSRNSKINFKLDLI